MKVSIEQKPAFTAVGVKRHSETTLLRIRSRISGEIGLYSLVNVYLRLSVIRKTVTYIRPVLLSHTILLPTVVFQLLKYLCTPCQQHIYAGIQYLVFL